LVLAVPEDGLRRFGLISSESSNREFRCVLRAESWRRVWGLVEPFEHQWAAHGHQYSTESTAVDWIVSITRAW
jgi:hypothetical protein